ncbi:MAG: sulfite exporter TauE/SafE family protein [Terriglobales bacterium]
MIEGLFLFSVALVGGALNSVAGGGGFLCFPALIFMGMPPINANATNTAALWPGTAASTAAYRSEIAAYRRMIAPLIITGILGGLMGAVLLLKTPQLTFLRMVPWLLLSATLLLVFSKHVTAWIGAHPQEGSDHPTRGNILRATILQLLIAVYIGFFGAGAGILMLAMLAVMGMRNIHAMNGLKVLLATVSNGVALTTFIVAKAVVWPQALLMVCGATLGGYGGAWYAQRVDPKLVRQFAVLTGACMTVYFFIKYP